MDNFEELAKAFRKEEMKTKHLQAKATKKAQVKVTRATKRQKANKLNDLRRKMDRKIEYTMGHLRQTNASDCESISFLKIKHAKLRQIISE